MFEKISKTKYPPRSRTLMIWDGDCGFCRYWITRWQKFTDEKIEYQPYQSVAKNIPDIAIIHFKRASRLIETDGRVYSGPRSAYRSFTYGSKWGFLDRWYEKSSIFQSLSDRLYNWVVKNRHLMFRLTKAMFGSNPEQVRPFWVIYLVFFVYILYLLDLFL